MTVLTRTHFFLLLTGYLNDNISHEIRCSGILFNNVIRTNTISAKQLTTQTFSFRNTLVVFCFFVVNIVSMYSIHTEVIAKEG